jgi:hypothetical protein
VTLLERIPARTEVPAEDGLYTVEESTYHADRGSLSCSGAKLLLPPNCPAKFKERMDNPPPAKRHFEFGHLVHLLVLGIGVPTVEIDADNYRTKAAQEARDAARAEGKIPVLVGADANDEFGSELAKAQAMADAVRAHPEAGELFRRGHAEKSLYWTDPKTGVRLRARADWLTLINERLTCVDLKTAASVYRPDLERAFWKNGYYLQNAWYVRLLTEIKGSEPDFAFVCVEKEPPYLVEVVRYEPEDVAEGHRLNRIAIDTYARCIETGEWPGYTDATTFRLPRWARNDTARAEADALIAELEGIA